MSREVASRGLAGDALLAYPSAMTTIVLCEDDDLIATMVALALRHAGYAVVTAGSAEAALEEDVGAVAEVGLWILDVNLPGRSGVELAAALRARGVTAPVLMLTALDATAAKLQAFDAGADDYLTKPFDLAELLARVAALLRRAARGRPGGAGDPPVALGAAAPRSPS